MPNNVALVSKLCVVAALFATLLAPAAGVKAAKVEESPGRPITKVVKMLEAMLVTSKADAEQERKLYAKYKCYCDQNEEEKKAEIEKQKQEIEILTSDIAEIKADTKIASEEAAKIQARRFDISVEKGKLDKIRGDENAAYLSLKADLTAAKDLAIEAIQELATVGADQSSFGEDAYNTRQYGESAADHTQYMAGFTGAQIRVLRAVAGLATSLGKKEQAAKLGAFLQLKAPFTGTYAAQSGEVMGVLKNMRDTFREELSVAADREAAAVKLYNSLIEALNEEDGLLQTAEGEKQQILTDNDGDLASKVLNLGTAKDALADAESFLEQLLPMCETKAQEYDKRVELRNKEEAAIAEAIAILNSDEAFEAFGKVTATSDAAIVYPAPSPVPFLMQLANVKNHNEHSSGAQLRGQQALSVLRKVASEQKSLMLSKVAALLAAENPFTTVLEAIDEMLKIIGEEEQMDADKNAWCVDERLKKGKALNSANDQIGDLKNAIGILENAIDNPVTGLKALIANEEEILRQNVADQTSETAQRKEENLEYQKNIEDLVEAEDLISKAIIVLKTFYDTADREGTGFLQIKKEDPAPPITWNQFSGQTTTAITAVSMLEFIESNTKAEEDLAHQAENNAQGLYETSMRDLKQEEADAQVRLADFEGDLAKKEKELLEKRKDLKDMEALKASIEAYLEKISPGCDFIRDNIVLRDRSRDQEVAALNQAKGFITDTPAYKTAVATAHNETLGDCADICHNNEDHVDCKACVAQVSVPGYCAGHPETEGC